MVPIKLGVIGISEGNGHPYSWAAIFDGYNKALMEECGFPSIPRYLAKQNWPDCKIEEAQVTHVWTQNIHLSQHIADTCFIDCVVGELQEMIEEVDAVLLARDDAENHFYHASPFLKSGVPVYIDKPISYSVKGLREIYELEQFPGQIFTCSALRYAGDFSLNESEYRSIGEIVEVHAVAPKNWDRYSIHVIEPLLNLCGDLGRIIDYHKVLSRNDAGALSVLWSSGVVMHIHTTGGDAKAPFLLLFLGSEGCQTLTLKNNFSAFRNALLDFVQGVIHRDVRTNYEFVRKVVSLIELGRSRG